MRHTRNVGAALHPPIRDTNGCGLVVVGGFPAVVVCTQSGKSDVVNANVEENAQTFILLLMRS
jgi:hypothetical protein